MKITVGSVVSPRECIHEVKRLEFTTREIRTAWIVAIDKKDIDPKIKKFLRKHAKILVRDLDAETPEVTFNVLLDNMKTEWALILSPDEFLEYELLNFIKILPEKVDANGFVFNRKNVTFWEEKKLNSKWRYPDAQLRLFRKKFKYPGKINRNAQVPSPIYRVEQGAIIHDWLRKIGSGYWRRKFPKGG